MSEPESLSTDEALDTHIRRHAYDRLLMISDGIFAIAITLAALEIKLPEHGAGFAEMAHAMLRPVIAYLVSFAVIGVFWISHRDLFARVRRVDAALTWLTLAMLCLVSLIPAMVHGIYVSGDDAAPFRLYALTMMACGTVNSAMWFYAVLRAGLLRDEVPRAYRWTRATASLAMPLLFTPMLMVEPARIPQVIIPVALVVVLFRRLVLPRWFARRFAGA